MRVERYYEYEIDYVGIVELDYDNHVVRVREYLADKTIEFVMPWMEGFFLAKGFMRKMEV